MDYDRNLMSQVDMAMDLENEAGERWDSLKEDWMNDTGRYKIVVRIEDASDERFNQEIEVDDESTKKRILAEVDKSNREEVNEIFSLLEVHE